MGAYPELTDKLAIVTGGRQGIGRGIALRLAKEGCNIAIFDIADSSQTVNEVQALDREAKGYLVDVSKADDVDEAVSAVMEDFGKIDILINDAGVAEMPSLVDTTEEVWDHTLSVNLKGTFLCSKAVAKHMMEQMSGKIVHIHSNAACLGYDQLAAYSASKGGIATLTMAMAVELGPYNINVNGIGPGTVYTELADVYLVGDREQIEIDFTPLRRLGTTEDIAGLVAFLVSDDASWLTGQNIYIDGGYSIFAA
ncbi:MAG: glucose 1-dehydrogenase [Anaerolineales bacterium]|nr:glucose 1-dehydrogenase [Anaerolineales bacterium]